MKGMYCYNTGSAASGYVGYSLRMQSYNCLNMDVYGIANMSLPLRNLRTFYVIAIT